MANRPETIQQELDRLVKGRQQGRYTHSRYAKRVDELVKQQIEEKLSYEIEEDEQRPNPMTSTVATPAAGNSISTSTLAPIVASPSIPPPLRQAELELRAKQGILRRSEAKELQSLREKPNPSPILPTSRLAARLLTLRVTDTAPHVIVSALAGTGKTTTLIEGLKLLKGVAPAITPSPQQQTIWDAICMSKGVANSVCFCAFNKSIATELQRRVPVGCEAMTMHSMGFKSINRAFRGIKVNSYRVQDVISEVLETNIRELRRVKHILIKATEEMVGLCKMNLINPAANWSEELLEETLGPIASHYDVELDQYRKQVFELIPRVLERCKNVQKDSSIDFNDMIWLPVVLELPLFRYDLLLIDEAQDLNRCQQSLAKRAGNRLIIVGDVNQAIYGFAGADSESMPRLQRELSEDGCKNGELFSPSRGCINLPLTVTRRCGRAIVKEAQQYVPSFEAHPTNSEGKISHAKYPRISTPDEKGVWCEEVPWTHSYANQVNDGDMVLCRVNAPLISQCFGFLKSNRKAVIQGRDVAQGLISTIKKLTKDSTTSVPTLVGRISDWVHEEVSREEAKRIPNENRIISLQDRADCLICFTEGMTAVVEVIARIDSLFTDNKDSPGIRLSSIHRAKGLEAKRVFFLQPKGPTFKVKSQWQRQQERNLLYVATTRAIEELIYVS